MWNSRSNFCLVECSLLKGVNNKYRKLKKKQRDKKRRNKKLLKWKMVSKYTKLRAAATANDEFTVFPTDDYNGDPNILAEAPNTAGLKQKYIKLVSLNALTLNTENDDANGKIKLQCLTCEFVIHEIGIGFISETKYKGENFKGALTKNDGVEDYAAFWKRCT